MKICTHSSSSDSPSVSAKNGLPHTTDPVIIKKKKLPDKR